MSAGDRRKRSAHVLDRSKVRARRIELEMSEQELARRLGVSAQTIDRVERGFSQHRLPLVFITDLADALGCRVHELVHVPGGKSVQRSRQGDVRRVGQLLAAAGGWADVDGLAVQLDWTLQRTLDALEGLDAVLERTGQRLAGLGGRDVRIVATPGDLTDLQPLVGETLRRQGPSDAEFDLLYRLCKLGPRSRFGNKTSPAVRRLAAAGLVEIDEEHREATGGEPAIRLTDDARYGLYL